MTNKDSQNVQDKVHDITSAAEYLGLGDFRMRMIVRQGLVQAKKVKVSEDSKVMKWVIPQSELDKYSRKHRRGFSGNYLYKVKLTDDQFNQIKVFCEESGIKVEFVRANASKTTKTK